MRKNLFIRVDGSFNIGTGHVYRCLALASELNNIFSKIVFLTNNTENLLDLIHRKGFETKIIDSQKHYQFKRSHIEIDEYEIISKIMDENKLDLNFLLIDNYLIEKKYEKSIRKFFKKIFVIDDLANREHDCDLLIDQNLYEDTKIRYNSLIPKNCKALLGPKYVILRPEFNQLKSQKPKNFSHPKNVLITFGGSDPTNECEKALDAILLHAKFDGDIVAITGINNPNFNRLKKKFSNNHNLKIFSHLENFSDLLAKSDLCIGAGGTTTWERMYLGIPSIVTIISSDQTKSIEFLSKNGYLINLGQSENVTEKTYVAILHEITPKILHDISLKSIELVDGKGCLRIKKEILQMIE